MNLLINGLVWCRVVLDLERLKGYQKSSLHRLKTFYLKTGYVVPDTISIFQLILIPILSYALVAGDKVLSKKVFSSPVFNIQYTPHHLGQRANKNSSRDRIFDSLGHSIIQSLGKMWSSFELQRVIKSEELSQYSLKNVLCITFVTAI